MLKQSESSVPHIYGSAVDRRTILTVRTIAISAEAPANICANVHSRTSVHAAAVLVCSLALFGLPNGFCSAETLPPSTAIPVYFTHSIDAGKVKPGTVVIAKTLQVVSLPGEQVLRKGTTITGHVVDARAFQFDPTPYAHQTQSYISIHFDQIQIGSSAVPIHAAVRALADSFESEAASRPQYLDDSDDSGTMRLIGGGEFSPLDRTIRGDNGEVIGYNREHSVFARLLASDDDEAGKIIHCDGTDTEQSVAIFSPSACGLYGFYAVSMPKNGDGDGMFTIESDRYTVKLQAGSTALLQLIPDSIQASRKN